MDMPTGTAVAAPGGHRRTVRGRGPPRRADALTSRPRAGGARYGVVVVHGSRAAHHRQKAAANLLRGGGDGSLSSSKTTSGVVARAGGDRSTYHTAVRD